MIMKKNWKNRSGVSPVIATILMVAITVVLAAVLYVMVMGFGGSSNSAPTGSFASKEKVTGGERLVFSTFSPETAPSAIQISITAPGGSCIYEITDAGVVSAASGSTAITGLTLNYTDLAGNKIINSGDYLTITDASAGDYTVTVLFASSGDKITDSSFSL